MTRVFIPFFNSTGRSVVVDSTVRLIVVNTNTPVAVIIMAEDCVSSAIMIAVKLASQIRPIVEKIDFENGFFRTSLMSSDRGKKYIHAIKAHAVKPVVTIASLRLKLNAENNPSLIWRISISGYNAGLIAVETLL